MGSLHFLLHWATRELKTGLCSAATAVWLMPELVQDTLWLLQIGTAETWQQKCSELHTHISFFSPLNTKTTGRTSHHGRAVAQVPSTSCRRCNLPNVIFERQKHSGEHTETLLAALRRFNKCMSQTEESNQACVKHCYSWKQRFHPMHRKFKGHEKCWSSGCLQLEVLALESLVRNWFWEGSR